MDILIERHNTMPVVAAEGVLVRPANMEVVPLPRLCSAVKGGDMKYLKDALGGATADEMKDILSQRLDEAIMVRRPSNSKEVYVRSPTLLMLAVTEWYPDVLTFLTQTKVCLGETSTVEDNTNKPAVYHGVTALHLAAIAGKLHMVKTLLESGAPINARTSLGDSPLFEASFEGHKTVVQYLVENAGDVSLANERLCTCLMIAAYADNVDVIMYLLENGADVTAVDREGRNVLFYNVSGGRLDTFAYLLDHGAPVKEDHQIINILMEAVHHGQMEIAQYVCQYNDLLNIPLDAVDVAGRNVLFYALHHPSTDILEFLLHFDVPIQASNDGRTLLMSACLANNMAIVQYLVTNSAKLGLDIHETDSKGRNCLFYAITAGELELFEYLRGAGVKLLTSADGVTVIMQAVAKNRSQLLAHFLKNGQEFELDVNAKDCDGWNAMLYAVASGHVHLFDTLVAYDAECEQANDGRTVLMQAAAKGNLDFLRLICDKPKEYRVYLNQKDADGWNCLFYPIQGNHLEAFKHLIKKGAKLCTSNNGHTVLMEAVGKNRPDFVHYLTTGASTLGIDINQKDKEGNNVLFYTAAGGNLNLLKTLLAAGCVVENDNNERNILMQAALHGHQAMLEYITHNADTLGIDIHQKDKDHRNVLFYCVEGGHMKAMKHFLELGVTFHADKDGRTNLMQACRIGHLPIVQYLVRQSLTLNVDINAKDKHGENALFYATRSKKLVVIECLLDFSIELVTNKYGVNVLSQSLAEQNEPVVQAILTGKSDISCAMGGKDVRGRTVLHHYVEKGDLKMIKHLGQFYSRTDDYDMDGVSLLMYAAARPTPDHLKILHYLLEKLKVDPSQLDAKHRDAIFFACQYSNPDACKFLINKISQIRCDGEGRNPLMVAAANGCLDVCEILLHSQYGTQLGNMTDDMGRTAVHYLAMNGKDSRILDLLVKEECALDVRDNEGMTAVMYACVGGHAYTLYNLLRKQAAIHVEDHFKRCALHYCFRKLVPSIKCVKLLVKYDIDVNHADQDAVTPLMLAAQSCSKSDINLVRFLLEHGANPVLQDNEGKDSYDYCPFDAEYVKAIMREKGAISKIQQSALSKYRDELASSVNINSVLRGLLNEKVFTKTLNFEVAKQAPGERISKLLSILSSRGSDAFRIFCEVLKKDGQAELAFNLKRESYHKDVEIFW